jgi:hypothetical protein
MKALTEAQVERYRHDGFLFPFPALDEAERANCLAGLERYERWLGATVPQADLKWRTQPHALLPWYADLVRHPRILDVVEDLIGPDILLWTGTFFIKEANSPTFAAWHQDSTYFGLEPHDQVTAWVALTDASREAGCMEVLSAHGAPRQMHHAALRLKDSINRTGQTHTPRAARGPRRDDDATRGRLVLTPSYLVRASLGAQSRRAPAHRSRHQLHPRPHPADRAGPHVGDAGPRHRPLGTFRPLRAADGRVRHGDAQPGL